MDILLPLSQRSGERPERSLRERSCLVSFLPSHLPSLSECALRSAKYHPTAFRGLSGFYIPRYSLFASGCGSNLLSSRHGSLIRTFKRFFRCSLRVISPVLSSGLAPGGNDASRKLLRERLVFRWVTEIQETRIFCAYKRTALSVKCAGQGLLARNHKFETKHACGKLTTSYLEFSRER